MSDIDRPSADVNSLTQCLLRAEKSIEFLQKEHSSALADLQQELSKWQCKYNDLTLRRTLGYPANGPNDQPDLQIKVQQLEKELLHNRNKVKSLTSVLEEKDKVINDYKHRLQIHDERHAVEQHKQYHRHGELKATEPEQRSSSIIRLSHQWLRHHPQLQQSKPCNRICLGHAILPDQPKPFKDTDDKHGGSRLRSLSVINRTSADCERSRSSFIGPRRSPLQPLAPVMTDPKDKQLLTKRQRHLLPTPAGTIESNKLLASRSKIKFSTVLPPITSRKIPLKATLPCEGEA